MRSNPKSVAKNTHFLEKSVAKNTHNKIYNKNTIKIYKKIELGKILFFYKCVFFATLFPKKCFFLKGWFYIA